MCFSAEADFLSGAAIGAVGVATLAHVDRPRDLPIAALPLGFALHQIASGFVWLGLEGHTSRPATDVAIRTYLLFAWVLLPILVPAGLYALEEHRRRRRAMLPLVVLGAAVGTSLLTALVSGPVGAHVNHHAIVYTGAGDGAGIITASYVLATCGTMFLSSHRHIARFGIANLAAVGLVAWVQAQTLTSVWCTWAAIASVFIYLHFRRHAHALAVDTRTATGPSMRTFQAPGE